MSSPLLLGTGTQTTPPVTDPTFDFAAGMPTGTSVEHNGVCIYKPAGADYKQAAANEARRNFSPAGQFRGLLLEPAMTNKTTGGNYDGIAVASWDNSESIDDAAKLAEDGLATLVPSGNVLRVLAEGGNSDNTGLTGNANPHSACAFARRVNQAGEGRITLWNGIGDVRFSQEPYQVVRSDDFVPTNENARLRMANADGANIRWAAATLVESDISPEYPIPGASGAFSGETLTIADAEVPDGTYDVEITGETMSATLFSETVSGDWTINGMTLKGLGIGQHIKKIVFKPDTGGPPPAPSIVRRPFGVWGLDDVNSQGEIDQNFLTQIKNPARGMVVRIPWYKIETARNVYNWTLVDQWIAQAESKTQSLGYDVGLIVFPTLVNFANDTNPYTLGVPAYIVDNPQEFGGASGGPGGMWPSNSTSGWRASKHHPEVILREEILIRRFIDRYKTNPRLTGIVIQETALGMVLSQTDFNQYGQGRGYLDRIKGRLTNLANYDGGPPFAIIQNSNFYHYGLTGGDQQANYEVRRHCWELNEQLASDFSREVFHISVPDSVGNKTSQGYSAIYAGINQANAEGFPGPWCPSLQWQQYTDSDAGAYTIQQCVDIAVTEFGGAMEQGGGVMQWPRAATRSGNDWDTVLGVYNSGPPYTTFRDRQPAAPPPPPTGYDPGLVQHPDQVATPTMLQRATAWTGQGAANQDKFTIAAAMEYQTSEATIYAGNLNRFRLSRLSNGQHYVQGRNGAVTTFRWNQGASGMVAGEKYLFVMSVDLSTAEGVGFEYAVINIATGAVATAGSFATWIQGEVMEVEQHPYSMWGRDGGGEEWPDESIYLGFWPGQFWDTGSIIDAFYDSVNNELKDPLGSDVTNIIGTPRYLLEAPAANYEAGSNRAVPGDALAKVGTGTFTDAP